MGIALNTLLMIVVAIAIPGVINRTRATLAGRKGLPFTISALTITQKIYIFGNGDREALSARFCNDVCNPAIHTWSVK